MRILLKFEIDCDPAAAWRAVHSPQVVAELYGPLVKLTPLSDLPTSWESGSDVAVQMHASLLPLGKQFISITDRETAMRGQRVKILRDSGIPLTGPLSGLDVWDHQIAVAQSPTDLAKTLWRERLTIGGKTAPLLWPMLWSVWQWRERRIKHLAPTWAYDPPATEPSPGSAAEN